MSEEQIKSLIEEKQVLRAEVRVAREAAEITAQLVAKQFEETDRMLRLFQAANSQRKAVLDAASRISIIAVGHDGMITLFNSGAENMLGYSAEEVVGRTSPVMFHLKEEIEARSVELRGKLGIVVRGFDTFLELARLSAQEEFEWTYVRKDGTGFPVTLSITPVSGESGELAGILMVAMDITERKRAETEILDAMKAAEEANRTKSAFLANMSHELRTPLNAIIGYSEMLQEEAEDRGLDEFIGDLKKIRSAGKHLLALINDVLDLSKIEAGRMDLYLENFSVPAVVDEVVSTIQPLMAQNSNKLAVDCPAETGEIHADLTRVRQVLFNLLSNASKFTENGTVELNVSRKKEDGKDLIYFKVSDTGIGMTPEQLKKMFHAFSQADASTTRKYGGTGLGLAISRRFCNMMGGDITVQSKHGTGTTFTATVPSMPVGQLGPVKDMAKLASAGDTAPVVSGINQVLLIDDDSTVHDLLTKHLSKEGFTVVGAMNGQKGIELARAARPIAIILDVLMPVMDGWAVLRALKADPELCEIPVIMSTMVDDRNFGFALGAADYLVKPVDRDRLISILDRHRKGGTGRVLVVEDDQSNRELLARVLRREGWNVSEAKNGRVALDEMKNERPDVILLDLMMPVMDGFEFTSILSKSEQWSKIPIIVVTAKDVTEDDRKKLNGGVENILQKGAYSRDDMLDMIKKQVAIYAAMPANKGRM